MILCRTAGDLLAARARTATPRTLVPTMGGLHEGHLSLVRIAAGSPGSIWATVFVNRAQFEDAEDFARYPRDEQRDLDLLRAQGVDVVYAPEPEAVWEGREPRSTVAGRSGIADVLEGVHRPGHLQGVEAVVGRLFDQALPDAAVFGEKDYQQLMLLRAVAALRDPPIRIVAAPVVREADGLACSSRNRLLGVPERARAAGFPAILSRLAASARGGSGEDCERAAQQAGDELRREGFRVDYVVVRDARDLAVAGAPGGDRVVLGAVHLGGVRLLDAWKV